MTNNQNDIDFDNQDDDFDQEEVPKASFKEAWDNNPLMKIGAVVLGAVVLFGLYMIFGPKEEGPQGKATLRIAGTEQVKTTPGTVDDIDDDMRARLQEQNLAGLDRSAKQGGSFIPLPIDSATSEEISIPQPPRQEQEDPLIAWRQAARDRANLDMAAPPDQDAPAEKEPEVVPMPTPVRPQQAVVKMDPNVAKALSEQMRVIIAAQAPLPSKQKIITIEPSAYTVLKEEEKRNQSTAGGTMGMGMPMAGVGMGPGAMPASASQPEAPKVIVAAGSIAYAQLLNELNSDIPGPVMAHVLSGPFAGGRALGRYRVEQEYLVLEFTAIVKDAVGYDIEGIALDEKTTLAGHQTDIDRHYFRRVILPAAAKFLEGYASAAAKTVTSTTTTGGGGVVQQEEELDTKKELMKGVEEAAGEISGVLTEEARRPITIRVAKGTTLGILFLRSVTTTHAGIK